MGIQGTRCEMNGREQEIACNGGGPRTITPNTIAKRNSTTQGVWHERRAGGFMTNYRYRSPRFTLHTTPQPA
jgi:hypothetical protein